jgi:uncharacterized membrane protein
MLKHIFTLLVTLPALLNTILMPKNGYAIQRILHDAGSALVEVCVNRYLVGTMYFEWGHAVAQLVEALRYKSEGCGCDSLWFHWTLY